MCARPHIKNATFGGKAGVLPNSDRDGYKSLEGKEHSRKTFIINKASKSPLKTIKCRGCDADIPIFFGEYNKNFCSVDCRANYYKTHGKERVNVKAKCATCLQLFDASPDQARRIKKELVVFCSLPCRQKHNARKGPGSHSTWKTVRYARKKRSLCSKKHQNKDCPNGPPASSGKK